MRSARLRLPLSITLLTIWVTSTDRCFASATSSRRSAGPLRGISGSLLGFGAVAATGLLAVLHPGGVEGAADDLVAHPRQVADPAAADQHDRMLLEVVSLTGDVGGHLDPAGQADASDLAQRRV